MTESVSFGQSPGGRRNGADYSWQESCLEAWEANGFRGIVQAVTGAGKTRLAVRAIERLLEKCPRNLRVSIVVPTRALMLQWKRILRIAMAEHDFPADFQYQIYVINSARYQLARKILKELQGGDTALLIADECHRYTGPENRRIFEFVPFAAGAPGRYYALGLTATVPGSGNREILESAVGRLIFRYSYENALTDGVVAEFVLFQIGLDFDVDEYEEYEEFSEKMKILRRQLCARCPVLKERNVPFFAILQGLAKDADDDRSELARAYLRLSYNRKRLVCMARGRLDCAFWLIRSLNDRESGSRKKIIIFSESIEQAEALWEALRREYGGGVGKYHSKAGKQANENALSRFRTGELSMLVTCKALDEGIDVPDAAIGIVLSGTGMERQRIQRLGRILRKSENKPFACLYYLFVKESVEEKGYFPAYGEHFRAEDLEYTDSRVFVYPRYEQAADRLLKKLSREKAGERVLRETMRCLGLGMLQGDWLLEREQMKKLERLAGTQAEKNYWITMGRLAIVRSGHEK